MGITFGGKPCADPNSAIESCARLGLPTEWYGKANQYANPLGSKSGSGYVLMIRQFLDELDLNAEHTLLFNQRVSGAETGLKTVSYVNLHVVLATCLTPGLRDDPLACYLVELADRRRLARSSLINKSYNLRSSPGGTSYYSATLNTGSAWTWTQMVSDIWTTVGTSRLGTYPGLPYTPHGTPDAWVFHAWYAIDALTLVLDRIGCALSWNNQTGAFTIVKVGDTDATATTALSTIDRLRCWDSEYIEPNYTRYPSSLRVYFPKHRVTPDTTGDTPYYSVDVTDPSGTPTGVLSSTYARVMDDMPAIYDSTGTLTNSSDLSSRASDRASTFFSSLRMSMINRVYSIPVEDTGIIPGSQIKAIRHGDTGGGCLTQVSSFPGIKEGNPFVPATGSMQAGGGAVGEGRALDGGPYESFVGKESGAAPQTGSPPATQSGTSTLICPCDQPQSLLQVMLTNFPAAFKPSMPVQTASLSGAQQDNFAVNDGTEVILFTTSSATAVTGLTNGVPGKSLLLVNSSASTANFTLSHSSGSSSAANRLNLASGVTLTVPPGKHVRIGYNGTSSLWDQTSEQVESVYAPTLSGSYNNYSTATGSTALIPTLSANSTLTGITNIPVGKPYLIFNSNSNSNTLALTHNSGSSSSGNKFDFSSGSSLTLSPGEGVVVINDGSAYVDTGSSMSKAGGGGGSGTVTDVSVTSANGFAGTVANSTTTPAITITTSITGVVKGNGTAISAATAGTDYTYPSGVSGGQTLIGGTGASETTVIKGTSHATQGTVDVLATSADTNSIRSLARIRHTTSGTAAAGFGGALTWTLENASGTETTVNHIDSVFTTATAASESVDVVFRPIRAGTITEAARIVSVGAVRLPEISTPSTPASGYDLLYFKTDGLYYKNPAGTESSIGGVGKLLTSGSASAAATMNVTWTNASYKFIRIYLYNVYADAMSSNLYGRTSTDGGSTWDSGANDYGSGNDKITITSSLPDSTASGGGAQNFLTLEAILYDPSGSGYKFISYRPNTLSTGAASTLTLTCGFRAATADIDGMQFYAGAFMGSPNITGSYVVYGYA